MEPTRKRKLGSYPALSVITALTISLMVAGLFGLLITTGYSLASKIKRNIEVQVLIKPEIGVAETENLRIELTKFKFIGTDANRKPALTFVPRDEAARKFIDKTGEDFIKLLGENPLPDAFLVKLNPDYVAPDKLIEIKAAIAKLPQVAEVNYQENLVAAIHNNLNKISMVLITGLVILIIVLVLLINNSLKLALFSQRLLIRSMQLVGARSWFIKRPFLVRAALHGLLSAVIAVGLLFGLYMFANSKLPEIGQLFSINLFVVMGLSLAFFGALLAVFSVYFTINKYLKLSLDELY